jgi:hypothetical protein
MTPNDYDQQFHHAELTARRLSGGDSQIFHQLMRTWREHHPEPIDSALRYLFGLIQRR